MPAEWEFFQVVDQGIAFEQGANSLKGLFFYFFIYGLALL